MNKNLMVGAVVLGLMAGGKVLAEEGATAAPAGDKPAAEKHGCKGGCNGKCSGKKAGKHKGKKAAKAAKEAAPAEAAPAEAAPAAPAH